MADSSFSSYFLLLCLSMFVAVSSVGKAMAFDYSQYNIPWDSIPNPPEPELGNGGDNYDYPQPPARESRDGGDYDYEYEIYHTLPLPPTSEPEYCQIVVERVSTCLEYLNGHEDSPSSACCDNLYDLGINALNAEGRSGFKSTCECIKDLQASFDPSRTEDGIFSGCIRHGGGYAYLAVSRQECSAY